MKTIIVLDFSTAIVHVCSYDDTIYDDVEEYLAIDPDYIGWQAGSCQAMTVNKLELLDHRRPATTTICNNFSCLAEHINTDYEGYCSQSCFDGV